MIDYNIFIVLLGAALLGGTAGLIGSFTVLRRRALAGDALAHAALPGLCLAYLVVGDRNLPVMLFGALCSGVLGTAAISGLRRWTRVRDDAAICIVLGVFFGAGIVLSRLIQNSSWTSGSKAGLNSFLLGSTAGVTLSEIQLIAALSAVCALLVLILFKEFKLTVFDSSFARSQGWPVQRLDLLLMTLAAVAVVLGLSTVGIVMMAGLLILPAAAARFWTDRFGRLLIVSAIFGAATALAGTAVCIEYERYPPGPIVVLTGSALFFLSWFIAPGRGAVATLLRQWKFKRELASGEIELVGNTRQRDVAVGLTGEPADLQFFASGAISSTGSLFRNGSVSSVRSTALSEAPLDASVSLHSRESKAESVRRTFATIVAVAASALLLTRWWNALPDGSQPQAAWTMAIGCLANIPCAVFGCLLLLRRKSLLGHAISHSVLPAIAIGFLLSSQLTGLPIVVAAVIVGVLTALVSDMLRAWRRVPEDSSLGIVYSTLFAAGVIMMFRLAAKSNLDPGCLFYGMLESAPSNTIDFGHLEIPRVLPTLAATCLYTFLFVSVLWKELKVAFFDPALASTMGISSRFVDYVLMGFVAAVAVAAFETLGSILVVAMFIVPAATARLLTDRLAPMFGWSIGVAVLSSIVGNIAAIELNTSAAGMMVLAAGLQFALAVFFAPRFGIVSKWMRGFSLSLRIAAEDIVAMLYRAEEAVDRGERNTIQASREEANAVIRGFFGWWAISLLQNRGEIQVTPDDSLELTEAGRQRARSIVRSHRLWETYLGEQTELPLDHLHAAAERMEHFIGPELQQKIVAALPAADVDPHGREIPTETGWRKASAAPSLPEVHRSVAVPRPLTVTVLPKRATTPMRFEVPKSASFWRMMLAFAGPGMMVSVGYMDPGNWATDLAGGARFGYALLSVVLISNFLAMLLQYLALKLGIVSGRDLAQACRDHYSKPTAIGLWMLCEVAIAACDLAEVIGSAIALNLLFGIPLLAGVVLTAADVFVILFLQYKGFRFIEALVVTLIFVIGGCFAYEIIASNPDWMGVTGVFHGLIPHTKIVTDPEMLFIAIGILGATVMPHNLYLHSSIVQTRAFERTDSGKANAIKFAAIDSTVALLFAFFINAAILVVSAATFHGSGHQNVAEIQDAHELLSPVLGASMASILFAVALLASGQNSTLTGTLAGQIVMEGFLNIHLAPWLRRLITRLMAIVPAVIVIAISGEKQVNNLLILSQVVLSLQLPFAVIPLVMFTSNKTKMGRFVNRPLVKGAAWSAALLIVALNALIVVQQTKNWLSPKETEIPASSANVVQQVLPSGSNANR